MNCPTKFIYEAAMKTPDILSPMDKKIHYNPAPEGSLKGKCWLCGCQTDKGHLKHKIILPTFTDSDLAKATWSNIVCEHCAHVLSYRELRNYSIYADLNGLKHPSRLQIRDMLLNPPEPPFLLCAAESGQRHLSFKAVVNQSKTKFAVRMDNFNVIVEPNRFRQLLEPIELLYKVFTKDEIGSGDYKSHKIKEFGLERWEKTENQIKPIRKSSLFQLALFVARREEENEV